MIHNVFHVSLLQHYKPDGRDALAPPPPIEVEGVGKYKAVAIFDSKYVDDNMSYYVK